jgi:hypothetical protein
MTMKSVKESLKQARRDASREVLAQIAAVIESRPDLSYKRIAKHFGCGTGLICQAAKAAGLSRPRGGASPAFRKREVGRAGRSGKNDSGDSSTFHLSR